MFNFETDTYKRKKSRLITAQKMKFSIKDFFSKCDQMRSFVRIWSPLLKKSLMENLILCEVNVFSWLWPDMFRHFQICLDFQGTRCTSIYWK